MGTEAFWIPAAIAAVGTGAQAYNQHKAATGADEAQAAAIRNQENTQAEGVAAARKTTSNIAKSNPNDIANKATADYVATARKAAASSATGGAQTFGQPTTSLGDTPGASGRFKSDSAAGTKQVQDYGNTYAGEMGQLDAAVRQRQNEGLSMEDLQTHLNTLGQKSWGQNFVDQLRAQVAGQANPWVNLLGGMLQKGASAYAMNAGGGAGMIPKGGTGIMADSGLTGSTAGLA